MHFILNAVDSDISEIKMEIDNYKVIELPVALKEGEIIKYTGGAVAYVYNKNWQLINEFDIDPSAFKVSDGEHLLTLDCKFKSQGEWILALLPVMLIVETVE